MDAKRVSDLVTDVLSTGVLRVSMHCESDEEAGRLLETLKSKNWQAMLQRSAFCEHEVVVVGHNDEDA